MTTPTQKIDTNAPAQPRVAGSSEAEDEAAKVPPPKVEVGSLTGSVMIDGKTGTYGLVTLEPANGKWKPRTPKTTRVKIAPKMVSPMSANLVAT